MVKRAYEAPAVALDFGLNPVHQDHAAQYGAAVVLLTRELTERSLARGPQEVVEIPVQSWVVKPGTVGYGAWKTLERLGEVSNGVARLPSPACGVFWPEDGDPED